MTKEQAKEKLRQEISYVEESLKRYNDNSLFLSSFGEKLAELGVDIDCVGTTICLTCESHDTTMKALLIMGGEFRRRPAPYNKVIHYHRKENWKTVAIVVVSHQPTPGCEWKEKKVEHPAMPARVAIQYELVCPIDELKE